MSGIEFISLTMQAILGGSLIAYCQYVHTKKKETQILGNYAKILSYKLNGLLDSYRILSNALNNIPDNYFEYENYKQFNRSLNELLRDYNPNNKVYPLIAKEHIINTQDIETWNRLLDKFRVLPLREFEIIYKFFEQTRNTAHELLIFPYDPSVLKTCKITISGSVTNVEIITLIFFSLSHETTRKTYQYILPNWLIKILPKLIIFKNPYKDKYLKLLSTVTLTENKDEL